MNAIVTDKLELLQRLHRARELLQRLQREQERRPPPSVPAPVPASFHVSKEDVERVTAALTLHIERASRTSAGGWIGCLVFVVLLLAWFVILVAVSRNADDGLGLLLLASIPSALIAMKVAEKVNSWVLAWRRARDPFRDTQITQLTAFQVGLFQSAELGWYESEAQRLADAIERERQAARTRADHWKKLSGVEFEFELGELYRRLGYEVSHTRATGDEGIDLVLRKPGELVVVQCKQHGKPAGQHFVRDLYGAMMHHGAQRAVLACTGGFTEQVRRFARGKPIELLDLDGILKLAGQD